MESPTLLHPCPACGSKLRVPLRLAGSPIQCPKCKESLAVPQTDVPGTERRSAAEKGAAAPPCPGCDTTLNGHAMLCEACVPKGAQGVLLRRIAALLLDQCLFWTPFMLVAPWLASRRMNTRGLGVLAGLIGVVLVFAYQVFVLQRRRASVGLSLLGLAIVKNDGSPAGLGRCIQVLIRGRARGWFFMPDNSISVVSLERPRAGYAIWPALVLLAAGVLMVGSTILPLIGSPSAAHAIAHWDTSAKNQVSSRALLDALDHIEDSETRVKVLMHVGRKPSTGHRKRVRTLAQQTGSAGMEVLATLGERGDNEALAQLCRNLADPELRAASDAGLERFHGLPEELGSILEGILDSADDVSQDLAYKYLTRVGL